MVSQAQIVDRTASVQDRMGHGATLRKRSYDNSTDASASDIHRILQRAGHEVDSKYIKYLTKFCHHCQMKGKSPSRFKFTLKDDYEFNYSVIIDVFYLEGKPVDPTSMKSVPSVACGHVFEEPGSTE
ncbi:uncharacterized protein N7515_010269 [Penicillium bovifimosum]|uniref:Uncharacterized protein n=1 Tax=Penicillium bovifimosum TaxID=126998 RepID=A0A9W9GIL4_9EURO|nr:uncharacterized protein N7515_010269 [Penicillium bovifimosum]KAJ5120881.1 hypothetical protein N7515_010269 [Penicillium bovifimosum]